MSQGTPTTLPAPGGSFSERNFLTVSGQFDAAAPYIHLQLPDGQIVRLETALLTREAAYTPGGNATRTASETSAFIESDGMTIPLIQEELTVEKRVVETGKVRLTKTTEEYQQALNEPLAVHTYEIERTSINQPVASVPEVRVEGQVTIYPVIEEQVVVTKQLILREEVRVTRRDTERLDTRVFTLRRENLEVVREPAS